MALALGVHGGGRWPAEEEAQKTQRREAPHLIYPQGLRPEVRMGRDGEESILGRGNSLNKGMAAIIDTAAHIPDGRLLLGGKGAGGKQELDGGRRLWVGVKAL